MQIKHCSRGRVCASKLLYNLPQVKDQRSEIIFHLHPSFNVTRGIEDFNESNLQIFHSKPNLEELLQDIEGSLEVKACGPERMLASLSSITQRLKASRGFEVDLDILESNL